MLPARLSTISGTRPRGLRKRWASGWACPASATVGRDAAESEGLGVCLDSIRKRLTGGKVTFKISGYQTTYD
jgi:hypothetical protein